ncbi:Ribonuclease S-F11 [Schistosoma japonicum]|nr:Ribonuclease S-F11 [Schistosoma japonicum]KAH8856152.1 Ribonuclease S-F11 [Schistosoma japonicum]KAH8856154.1 Ribonuclease S-F11 [Schistosoma japonicum]
MLHLLLILVARFVLCTHVCGERQWDYLVYSLEWPPTYCFTHTCKLPYNINNFNIHGLWPSIWPSGSPTNCPNYMPFEIDTIKPIYTELQKEWANLDDFDDPKAFWKHEWQKHGVCALSDPIISNELDYFNISLIMKSKVNLLRRLESIKIIPSDSVTLKRDVLLNQLKNLFNVDVLMYCFLIHHKPAKLAEIRLCLNPSMEFISCPSSIHNIDDYHHHHHHHYKYESFLSSFSKNILDNFVCQSQLPWINQSTNCLLHSNAPCPDELIFPDFN